LLIRKQMFYTGTYLVYSPLTSVSDFSGYFWDTYNKHLGKS
jgi:hypothetical protein